MEKASDFQKSIAGPTKWEFFRLRNSLSPISTIFRNFAQSITNKNTKALMREIAQKKSVNIMDYLFNLQIA